MKIVKLSDFKEKITETFEFKQDAMVETADFWGDLFEGGYIKIEDILVNENEIIEVKKAIAILKEFKNSLENNDLMNYY